MPWVFQTLGLFVFQLQAAVVLHKTALAPPTPAPGAWGSLLKERRTVQQLGENLCH